MQPLPSARQQGQPVPTIYVLPPRLFVGAVNFGEVEFPIYFNFFIKKAFQNPDLRGALLCVCVCVCVCVRVCACVRALCASLSSCSAQTEPGRQLTVSSAAQ
jgi:hypothetical protein